MIEIVFDTSSVIAEEEAAKSRKQISEGKIAKKEDSQASKSMLNSTADMSQTLQRKDNVHQFKNDDDLVEDLFGHNEEDELMQAQVEIKANMPDSKDVEMLFGSNN